MSTTHQISGRMGGGSYTVGGGMTAGQGFAVGSIISSVGEIANTFGEMKLSKINAQIRADERRFAAILNARIAERNARIVKERNDFKVAALEKQLPFDVGAVVSAYGKAGVTGETAALVEDAVQKAGILKIMAVKFEGFIDVQNELIGASFERIRARNSAIGENIDRSAANIQFSAGLTRSTGNLLSKVSTFKDKGLFDFLNK